MAYFTYKMYNHDAMYNGNNYIDDNDGWTRMILVQKNSITYIYIVKKKNKNHKKKNTTQIYLILLMMMIIGLL